MVIQGNSWNEKIKYAREEIGYSQGELAGLLGTKQQEISRWETGMYKPSPYHRRKLSKVLRKSPEALGLLEPAELEKKPEPEKPEYRTLQNLPFIGRNEDIKKILEKLQDENLKLFAITGTIGVGKSALAYQVAKEAIRTGLFANKEVRPIHLADETSTEGAVKLIKDTIEDINKELQRLNLPNTRILLVINNCEHLKAEKLFKLIEEYELKEYPQKLTILATSSVRMTPSDHPIQTLKPNEAVQLFFDAAKEIGKTLTDNEVPKVEELCRLLDGLPLALLLAAGLLIDYKFNEMYKWAKENSLLNEEIFFPSQDDRHKTTLKVLFEKHYKSLGKNAENEQEGQQLQRQLQKLFRRLAIFVAPCSIKSVKAVCIINNDLPDDEKQLQKLLIILKNHYLITYENDWIEIIHNILRIFAISLLKLKENKEEASEVQNKFIDNYRSLAIDYMNKRSKNEELEITEYLKNSHEKFKNILHAYELIIEIRLKNILGKNYEIIQYQLINYAFEYKTTDFSTVLNELIKQQYTSWRNALEEVSEQEQELTHNPPLALWKDFCVMKSDMFNLTGLYKEFRLYK